jgi:hypothetical protein
MNWRTILDMARKILKKWGLGKIWEIHNYFLILFKFQLDNKLLEELVFNKSN